MVQYREKSASTRRMIEEAGELCALCRKSGSALSSTTESTWPSPSTLTAFMWARMTCPLPRSEADRERQNSRRVRFERPGGTACL